MNKKTTKYIQDMKPLVSFFGTCCMCLTVLIAGLYPLKTVIQSSYLLALFYVTGLIILVVKIGLNDFGIFNPNNKGVN